MRIDLVLSDDWEIRGDGTGDPRTLQFATARRLMDLYERTGIRGSFNVEVMQQLMHREWGSRYSQLATLASEWDECVREMLQRGHDVQLHVHPQWHRAFYDGSTWQLQPKWSIVDYAEEDARQMLYACRNYLHDLLQPLDPTYRCRAFRSGSWGLAPSPFVLRLLVEIGITFDMSLGHGLHFDLPMVQVDYRELEEPFLPFYPCMDDARRVASKPSPIVCVPTHSRRESRTGRLRDVMQRVVTTLISKVHRGQRSLRNLPPTAIELNAGAGAQTGANYSHRWADSRKSRMSRLLQRRYFVTDLSLLDFNRTRAAVTDARRRTLQSGHNAVPVIFENHTKNLGNFAPLEAFCELLRESPDIHVITASELARRLTDGVYPIRTKSDSLQSGDAVRPFEQCRSAA